MRPASTARVSRSSCAAGLRCAWCSCTWPWRWRPAATTPSSTSASEHVSSAPPLPVPDRTSRLASGLDLATLVLFGLALLAPAVDQCLRPDGVRDCRVAEQRNPEPRPPLPRDLNELAIFPRHFENHYDD